jgi:hypothetical protein
LSLIADLLPAIFSGIVTVEKIFASANGQTKKSLVISAVLAGIFQVGQAIPEPHIQQIGAVIDSVVSVLNSSGIFKKAGA